jgi:hypothetical protein
MELRLHGEAHYILQGTNNMLEPEKWCPVV